jgi:hypothetical protein
LIQAEKYFDKICFKEKEENKEDEKYDDEEEEEYGD